MTATGLLIRGDRAERVLRSVGEQPNGILCMVTPDGVASWAIDGSAVPNARRAAVHARIAIDSRGNDEGIGSACTAIAPDELVAALESPAEAVAVIELLNGVLEWALRFSTERYQYEFLRSHAELAEHTRDALIARGFLRRSNPDA